MHTPGFSSEPAVPASQVWGRQDLIPGVNRVNRRSLGNRTPGHNFLRLPRGPRTVGTRRDRGSVYPTHLGPKDQETEQWNYLWAVQPPPLLSLHRAAAPCPWTPFPGLPHPRLGKHFEITNCYTHGGGGSGCCGLARVRSRARHLLSLSPQLPGEAPQAGRTVPRAPSCPVAAPAAPQRGAPARTNPEPASPRVRPRSPHAPARAHVDRSQDPRAAGPPRTLRRPAPPAQSRSPRLAAAAARWCAPRQRVPAGDPRCCAGRAAPRRAARIPSPACTVHPAPSRTFRAAAARSASLAGERSLPVPHSGQPRTSRGSGRPEASGRTRASSPPKGRWQVSRLKSSPRALNTCGEGGSGPGGGA